MVIIDEQVAVMRWPWQHEHHPTPLEEATMLTEYLLAEHSRLVLRNEQELAELRRSVNDVTTHMGA